MMKNRRTRLSAPCQPCYPGAMIHDLITAFLVAFAAVTASAALTRIWEMF